VAEMPELVELHQEWKEKGVRVQTVALDLMVPRRIDTVEGIAAFAAERGFALPILAFQGEEDDLGKLAEHYEMSGGIPLTLAISRNGKVVDRIEGRASKERLERMIEKALL